MLNNSALYNHLKLFILVALLFTTAQLVTAQNSNKQSSNLQQITASPIKMYYLQYDATPYVYNEWRRVDLILSGGEVYHDIQVKIDAFTDNLVYFNDVLKKQLIIDKNIISELVFTDTTDFTPIGVLNVCVNDSSKEEQCKFYFVELEDSISVWSRHSKKIERYTEPNKAYGKIGRYYSRVKYYYVLDDEVMSIPKSKSAFLKCFPEIKKPLSAFIRKNKYSLKEANDVVAVFTYVNKMNYNR